MPISKRPVIFEVQHFLEETALPFPVILGLRQSRFGFVKIRNQGFVRTTTRSPACSGSRSPQIRVSLVCTVRRNPRRGRQSTPRRICSFNDHGEESFPLDGWSCLLRGYMDKEMIASRRTTPSGGGSGENLFHRAFKRDF